MSAVITALTNSTTGITSEKLYSDLAVIIPLVVIIFGISFGLYILHSCFKTARDLYS